MTAIGRGSPASMGFMRSLKHDGLSTTHFDWEVWRTPEGVLVTLPPGCVEVGLQAVHGPRGETLACVEPEGVCSIWLFKKRGEE